MAEGSPDANLPAAASSVFRAVMTQEGFFAAIEALGIRSASGGVQLFCPLRPKRTFTIQTVG